MKKWLLITLLVVLLTAFFLLLDGILLTAELSVKSAVYAYTGRSLNYEKAYFQDGNLVIENPQLGQSHLVYADRLLIGGKFNRQGRAFDLDVIVEKPRYSINVVDANFGKLSSLFSKSSSWNPIHPRFKIHDGIIQCHFPDKIKSPIVFRVSHESGALQIESDFQQSDCQYLTKLLYTINPKLKSWNISSGTMDGNIALIIPENQNPYFKGDLIIKDLSCRDGESSLAAGFENITISLHPDGVNTLIVMNGSALWLDLFSTADAAQCNGNINLCSRDKRSTKLSFNLPHLKGQGNIQLAEIDNWQSWDIKLAMEEGKIDVHSSAKLQLAGLSGMLDFKLDSKNEFVRLTMNGNLKDLIEVLPDRFKTKVHKSFDDDLIGIAATIEKKEIKGVVHIGKADVSAKDVIHFGIDLGQKTKGWFYANQIPLEKYIEPFIFPTQKISLKGVGEFKGSLDGDLVSLKYGFDNLSMENGYFLMKMPTSNTSSQKNLLGYHVLELSNFTHHGSLPIENGSYLEKKSGLLFTGIMTQGLFEEGICFFDQMEAFCENMFLEGDVELDNRDPAPGYFSVRTKVSQCNGKSSDIQHILAHFDLPEFVDKFPIQGDISCRDTGMLFTCDFAPDNDQIFIDVQAALSNGTVEVPALHASIKDLSMDIDYHHDKQLLIFKDLQGTILVGKTKNAKEYMLGGSQVAFNGLDGKDVRLDMFLTEKNQQIGSLVGQTQLLDNGDLEFVLDQKLSHIGHICPSKFKLLAKDWSNINQFVFNLQFPLTEFVDYLSGFEESGWLLLSKRQLNLISFLNLGGDKVDLSLGYNSSDNLFSYEVDVENLGIYQGSTEYHRTFDQFLLKGRNQDKKWFIDQCSLGQFALSAEISNRSDELKIDFLGLRYGDSLLVGLEGKWLENEGSIESKINLLEWNISDLAAIESIKDVIDPLQPQGILRGAGQLSLVFLPHAPWLSFKSSIDATIVGGQLKDSKIDLKNPLAIQINSESGIEIENIQFSLNEKEYDLKKCVIELTNDELLLAGQTNYENCPLSIQCYTAWPTCSNGEIVLKDPTLPNHLEPLHINWIRNPSNGVQIESMFGYCAGMTCNLKQHDDSHILEGSIEVNLDVFSPLLLNTNLAETIYRLKIGPSYLFEGKWGLNFDRTKSLTDQFDFHGKLQGYQTKLKGFQVERLEVDLDYNSPRLDMKNFQLKDVSGTLSCEQLTLIKNPEQENCSLWIPKIVIKNLRPNLLNEMGKDRAKTARAKPLVIRRMDVDDFYGIIDDLSSWQATGSLRFSNSSRKYAPHPLFAIPAELILRLGLDPNVLNPVTGSINFNLRGDRLYFTKFKDVYSEGRGSKFYLSDEIPSWMDLHGKLSVHVRMKQYNLMFKIAELFTVSVQGTFKKPNYSLQKTGGHGGHTSHGNQ